MRNAILLALMVISTSSLVAQKNTVPTERWSNEKIWYSGMFRSEGVYGIRSMADGIHYTSLESSEAGNAVVKYAYATGSAVDTLAKSSVVYGGEPTRIGGYQFSSDETKLLLSSDSESIYRHSYLAAFHVYEVGSEEAGVPLRKDGTKVRLATFSPAGDKVAFVQDNNLWVVGLECLEKAPVQLTMDGQWNSVINGASDWVYEEEFGKDRGFYWSPNGQYIAFYRFDESQVREFAMPMYGQLYPEPYTFKYPKAGEINSKVSIHSIDVNTGRKSVLARVDGDNYIPRIMWMGEQNKLMVMRMNRHQNKMELLGFDLSSENSRQQSEEELLLVEEAPTHVPVQDNFTFLADGSFLMTSMKDGFNHLYWVRPGKIREAVDLWENGTSPLSKATTPRGKWCISPAPSMGPPKNHLAKVDLRGTHDLCSMTPKEPTACRWSRTFDFAIHNHSDAGTPPSYVSAGPQMVVHPRASRQCRIEGDLVRLLRGAPRILHLHRRRGRGAELLDDEAHGL